MTHEREEYIRKLLGMPVGDPDMGMVVILCEMKGEPVGDEKLLELPSIMNDYLAALDRHEIKRAV